MATSDDGFYFVNPMQDNGSAWAEETFSTSLGKPYGYSSADYFPLACTYIDGIHVFPGPHCPHEDDYNSNTEENEPGWTVLKNITE